MMELAAMHVQMDGSCKSMIYAAAGKIGEKPSHIHKIRGVIP